MKIRAAGFALLAVLAAVLCARPSRAAAELTPSNISASSALYESGYDYNSYNLNDWNYSTAWVEGADGDGIGEYVDYYFSERVRITSVAVLTGYCKDDYVFYINNAVTVLGMQTGSASADLYLSDSASGYQEGRGPVEIMLSEPMICEGYVRFTIKGVRSGSKYTDSCISEIHVYGERAPQEAVQTAPVTAEVSSWADSSGNNTTSGFGISSGGAYTAGFTDDSSDDTGASEAELQMLSAFAHWVYQRYAGWDSIDVPEVSLNMLSEDDLAFLLYWYQYHYAGRDSRITSDMERNYANPDDLRMILADLDGFFSHSVWNRFVEAYVEQQERDRYYMNGTGDFGDAGPYMFLDPVDEGTTGGLRCISGSVVEGSTPVKRFKAWYKETGTQTLEGWRLDHVMVSG